MNTPSSSLRSESTPLGKRGIKKPPKNSEAHIIFDLQTSVFQLLNFCIQIPVLQIIMNVFQEHTSQRSVHNAVIVRV